MGLDDFMKKAAQLRPWAAKKVPIGVNLSVGRRSDSRYGDVGRNGQSLRDGLPVFNNRFFVMEYKPSETVQLGGSTAPKRRAHPAYMEQATVGNRAVTRPIAFDNVQGTLIHQKIEDAIFPENFAPWSAELSKMLPGAKRPQGSRPFCVSRDAETADRWNGTGYDKIPCLNENCPIFAARLCKCDTSFVFRLDTMALPDGRQTDARVAYLHTKGKESRQELFNLASYLRGQCEEMRVEENCMGVRIEFAIQMKIGVSGPYPIVIPSPVGDIVENMRRAASTRDEIRRLMPSGVPTAREAAEESLDVDSAQLSGELLRPMVLPRPDGVRDPEPERGGAMASERSHEPPPQEVPPTGLRLPDGAPPLTLGPNVPTSPGGEPTCPLCDALMTPARGQRGWGWLCVERTNGCKGARVWDGSVPDGVSA